MSRENREKQSYKYGEELLGQYKEQFGPMYREMLRLKLRGDRRERRSAIEFLNTLGPKAREAAFAANPDLKASLDAYNGPLLAQMRDDAMAAGPTDISKQLNQQALDELKLGRQLGADELRTVTQGTREGYADRGLTMSNPAIVSEVMNRDAAGQARLRERQGFASAINNQLINERQGNRQWQGNVQGMMGNAVAMNQAVDPAMTILGMPTGTAQTLQMGAQPLQQVMGYQHDYWNTYANADFAQEIAKRNAQAGMAAGEEASSGATNAALIGGGAAIAAAGIIVF